MAIIAGAVLLIAVNMIVISVMVKYGEPESGIEKTALYISAPFQNAFHYVVNGSKNLWRHYFFLVFAARENEQLKKTLQAVRETNRRLAEIELANIRLRRLLEFRETVPYATISAEVVGRDPSHWFKTIVVNKGTGQGVRKGLPVVTPEGIVGQVIECTPGYSKILLAIDQKSAVDAMIQRTRTRGIVEGDPGGGFNFKYVLRKEDVRVGDRVISSGLDGVFPKGFDLGSVSGVVRPTAGMFQVVTVLPSVDFERLEEVLMISNPPAHAFMENR